jgi:outer membrane protein assembly factor BamB
MDLASPDKTVAAFKVSGATIAGSTGPALGRDGTVYIATMDGASPLANSLIALEPKTLKLKASATVPKASLSSSPLVLPWKSKDVVIAAGGGRLFLFDAASLGGGPIATSPAVGAGAYESGALASWQDAEGTRWIAARHARGIATFKLVEQDGKAVFQPGWNSREIASPLPPLVVNGVVFAASTGSPAAPAVLYAIDAASGKELWNSGRTITSTIKGGLSAGQGNVYVPGADSTLYAFGFAIEK